jgi:hypothetical protein
LAQPAAAAQSGTLSYANIEGFWVAAGGPSSQAATAAAITGAESNYQPGIIQQGQAYSTTGWGLWQITPGSSESQFGQDYQLLDPWNNAEAAVAKYKAAGNSFSPWTTYNNGAYKNFLQSGVTPLQICDPGQYVPIGGSPSGTHNTSQPGTTYGPAMSCFITDGSVVSVGVNPTNDHQFLFWRGSNGHVWESWNTGSWNSGYGKDMQTLFPKFNWSTDSAPSVAVDNNDRQYVFWLRGGHIIEAWNTGTWQVNDMGWAAASGPGIGVNPTNDHQYVFWLDSNGQVMEAYNQGVWHGPIAMGWIAGSAPSVAVDNHETQTVVWKGKTNSSIFGAVYSYSPTPGWSSVSTWPGTTTTRPAIAVNPQTGDQYLYWKGETNSSIYSSVDRGPVTSMPPDATQPRWTTSAAPTVGVASSGHQYIFWAGATNSNIYEGWNSAGTWAGPVSHWAI